MHLQLAPTLRHQAMAMMSLLKRYNWHTFSVITSRIGGHASFAQVNNNLFIVTIAMCQLDH